MQTTSKSNQTHVRKLMNNNYYTITRGNVHAAKRFYPLVREAAEKHDIEKLYADKAYYNRRNFNLLDQFDVELRLK